MTAGTATDKTSTYTLWRRVAGTLAGRVLFSAAMCIRVPYFRTVLPLVRELRHGYCEVVAPKWWGVRNHLGTFHAIAACNLAEIAMGMLAEATVPATHRWIPKGMNVSYVAKGATSLTAVAELSDFPDFDRNGGAGAEVVVPVTVADRSGRTVARAEITVWVTPQDRRVR